MLDFGFYNMDCMDGMKEFPDGVAFRRYVLEDPEQERIKELLEAWRPKTKVMA